MPEPVRQLCRGRVQTVASLKFARFIVRQCTCHATWTRSMTTLVVVARARDPEPALASLTAAETLPTRRHLVMNTHPTCGPVTATCTTAPVVFTPPTPRALRLVGPRPCATAVPRRRAQCGGGHTRRRRAQHRAVDGISDDRHDEAGYSQTVQGQQGDKNLERSESNGAMVQPARAGGHRARAQTRRGRGLLPARTLEASEDGSRSPYPSCSNGHVQARDATTERRLIRVSNAHEVAPWSA